MSVAVKRTQNFHDHLHTPHPLEEGDNQAKGAKNDIDTNYFLKFSTLSTFYPTYSESSKHDDSPGATR